VIISPEPLPEIPPERKHRSATLGLMQRIRMIYDALVDRYGDEGVEFIRDVSEQFGLQMAERARLRVAEGTPREVGLYLVRVFDMVGADGEVTDLTPDRVAIRVASCPYPFRDPRVCEAHTTMERALVQELGQDLDYTITHSIPRGDPYCEHVVHWRDC
jgi:predicted ArsR family transcriptional regulator